MEEIIRTKFDIDRVWCMPSKDTFDVKPIGNFVKKYLEKSIVSVDPFARNKNWATYTNDLNPETSAQNHMYAHEFLAKLVDDEVKADLVIFDPPYSMGQVKVSYENVGASMGSHFALAFTKEKDLIKQILTDNGVFLHFGWHTNGMGLKRGFDIVDILVVAHGGAHYDTLCMAEVRNTTLPIYQEEE